MSASNYPPGVNDETPDAPWNQSDPEDKEFSILCSQTLSKSTTVLTDNYVPGDSGVDYEPDGEGGYYSSAWQDPDDTSDTNWEAVYHDNDHYTPLQLIALFKQFLEEYLSNGLVFKTLTYTKHLLKECDGWQEDEVEYLKDN